MASNKLPPSYLFKSQIVAEKTFEIETLKLHISPGMAGCQGEGRQEREEGHQGDLHGRQSDWTGGFTGARHSFVLTTQHSSRLF